MPRPVDSYQYVQKDVYHILKEQSMIDRWYLSLSPYTEHT